jgi:hypothetical protein
VLHAAKRVSFVVVATLFACNAASPLQPFDFNHQPAALLARAPSHGSWMDPSAKAQRLMYVSDPGNRAVYVYAVSSNTLVGTLTHFTYPLGECIDAQSNVWIVDNDQLVEYAHGGTTPIGSIPVGYYGSQHPYSCAVDPTTGDIAISIINRYQGNDAGLILICTPRADCGSYVTHARAYVYFVSYDKNGNLYADGLKRDSGNFWMVMRPAGGVFEKFTIKGANIASPGGLVHAEGVFSVGAPGASGNSIIYQVASDGTVTGTTQLSGADGCNQFVIEGNTTTQRVTCPNSAGANVTKYPYPAGGDPVVTISGPFASPFAVVYSN